MGRARDSKKRSTPGAARQAITFTHEKRKRSNKGIIYGNQQRDNKERPTKKNTRMSERLTVMYTNADQFLNKKDELLVFIAGSEPTIIMITEVIPKAQENPTQIPLLNITGYKVFVNCKFSKRNLGASGIRGVAIYAKDHVNAREVSFNYVFKDHVSVEIGLTEQESLLCGCLYRSPNKDKTATLESTRYVCDIISIAVERNNTHLLITGEFNYRGIDWDNESFNEKNEYLSLFVNTTQDIKIRNKNYGKSIRYQEGTLIM